MPHERRLTRIPEETREPPEIREKKPPVKQSAARQLDGTGSDWNYRGRSESDDIQPQPFPAPAGLAAQKHEGFQRFYRAVVSPTHVRVTAGGRIVPNNRSTSSPTSKWDKDKTIPESVLPQSSPDHIPPPPQPGFSYPPLPYSGFPAMYTSFVPGLTHGLHHPTGTFPYLPWQMGGNMSGTMAMPIAASPVVPEVTRTKASSKDSSQSERPSESGVSDKVRYSWNPHLDSVEPLRGALYPGHWMMPPSAPFFHFGMGLPPAYPAGSLPSPSMHPHAIPMQHPVHVGVSDAKHPGENDAPARSSIPAMSTAAVPAAPSAPPMTSIRPSSITTRHLEILRARLKHLEDQLQYNKHQIDERLFQKDAQALREQIQQFEKTLEQQIGVEDALCPKSTRNNAASKSETDKTFKGFYYGPNATYGGAFSESADKFIDRPQYYNRPDKKAPHRSKHGNRAPKFNLSD